MNLFGQITVTALALGLGLSAQAAEVESQIKALSCTATNGVTFHSGAIGQDRQAVEVTTQWGIFQKKFTARLAASVAGETHTVIELHDQDGKLSYLIDLAPPAQLTLPVVAQPVAQPSDDSQGETATADPAPPQFPTIPGLPTVATQPLGSRFGTLQQAPVVPQGAPVVLATVQCDLTLGE